MIAYFDTSALVKLLIDEPGSITTEQAWLAADVRMCVSIGITEAAAAIGRAWRVTRITEHTAHELLQELQHLWTGITLVPVDEVLAQRAAELAVHFGLRGYDAVHLAAAGAPVATLVAADGALLQAAQSAGLAFIDAST